MSWWLAAAAPAALGALGTGLSAAGIGRGGYEQIGGATDEELARMKREGLSRAQTERQLAMQSGAGLARQNQGDVLRALGERAAQMGTARSGMLPGAAAAASGDVNALLARLALDAERMALARQGQIDQQFLSGKAGQQYVYEPGWAEQLASFGGGLAGAAMPAVGAYYGAGGGGGGAPAYGLDEYDLPGSPWATPAGLRAR